MNKVWLVTGSARPVTVLRDRPLPSNRIRLPSTFGSALDLGFRPLMNQTAPKAHTQCAIRLQKVCWWSRRELERRQGKVKDYPRESPFSVPNAGRRD